MKRYLVRVWAKRPQQKTPFVVLNYSDNSVRPFLDENEIWVAVRASTAEEAAKKAKILWELT